ncbi:MAG: DUF4838 domain-containing protein [Ignavibacteriales bacterium]|nr:DUF4838 domain-containing protein [Ignavibacteriales bacterium]
MNYPVVRFLAHLLALLGLVAGFASSKSARPVTITRAGKAVSCIVITRDASATDRKAAEELQKYIKAISGAQLRIKEGKEPKGSACIWIGSAGHSADFPFAPDWAKLEDDGFTIRSMGNRILIAGGRKRGSLYGVYTLLETFLGCRKFSPTVEVIPKRATISLPAIDITQVPKFLFRDAFWYDPAYMAWHKLDNHDEMFGLYVHTFARLVPPEKYFKEHPEYFTKTRAGRIPDGQLCLTNPDVERIVKDRLREYMAGNPGAQYWSISQNDTFNPCECDSCHTIDSLEGSKSGSLLSFVNRIAAEFPEKTISTLAYQYTRSAPKHIKPADNVNIMLCSIECNRSRPLETDTGSASFRRDVEEWTSLTKNIYLWDYVVQFRNLMSPFPNFRVLQPNIQYFAKRGITAMFEQGSGTLPNEFKELRTYLIAKLLWDPDIKVDSVMGDFLRGYYGKAAPFVRAYIDTMHNALERSGEELGIYGFPLPSRNGYLDTGRMDEYVALFDKAEEAVKSDTAMLQRVKIARLPSQFALLEQAKIYGTGERGFFERGEDGLWRPKPGMEFLLDAFVSRCKEYGIVALNEIGTTPDMYQTWTREFLTSSMKNHLALLKPVVLKDSASKKYHDGDESALTDGLKGLDDYHLNWLGFHGVDMEATIDLGSPKTITRMRSSFLQNINAWIFLPISVEYWISNDGQNFRRVVDIQRAIPQDRKGIWSVSYPAEIDPVEARYVRVKATSLKTCPNWHKGAGGLCWIFADEIIVE